MSNETVTYVVGALCAFFALSAYIALILVPAWSSYDRLWERIAASFLSLYVLAAFVAVGVAGGAAVVYFWDRISA